MTRKEHVRALLHKEASGVKGKFETVKQIGGAIGDFLAPAAKRTAGRPNATKNGLNIINPSSGAPLKALPEGLPGAIKKRLRLSKTNPKVAPTPGLKQTESAGRYGLGDAKAKSFESAKKGALPQQATQLPTSLGKQPTNPGIIRRALRSAGGAAKRAPGATVDFAKRNPKKSAALGLVSTTAVGTKALSRDEDNPDTETMAGPATATEMRGFAKDKTASADKRKKDEDRFVPKSKRPATASLIEGVDDRATAAGGGAIAGGVAGYHAADALGVDKITGTVGGAALTAVAAALLAHNMRNA